jgi:hypothetical protein|tara:strand:- start:398 stop:634 length:237 start_codon:yes stop_codon:yes gene_type:complete
MIGLAGAKVALCATSDMAGDLSDYQIVVYSAKWTTTRLARSIARKTGLDVLVHGKGELRHDKAADLFASAKIFVSLLL